MTETGMYYSVYKHKLSFWLVQFCTVTWEIIWILSIHLVKKNKPQSSNNYLQFFLGLPSHWKDLFSGTVAVSKAYFLVLLIQVKLVSLQKLITHLVCLSMSLSSVSVLSMYIPASVHFNIKSVFHRWSNG